MRRAKPSVLLPAAVLAASWLLPGSAAELPEGDGPWVLRGAQWTDESLAEIATWFDHVAVYEDKGIILVHADDRNDLQRLIEAGLTVTVDQDRTETLRMIESFRQQGTEAVNAIPGFECYRTVEEMFAVGAQIAAEHPTLAEWIDIGDSWEKTEPGGLPGWDIFVLKLTNSAVAEDKPALLVTGSTHAREYTTAELVTRFGELLTDRYDHDPDITWLLDHHEVHLILVLNPDTRKVAETGEGLARKNANNNFCPNTATRGIDLNRGLDFNWGHTVCQGSSNSACSLTFHGPFAASEPEAQALQDYMNAIFPDQRPDDQTTPAPITSEGIFLDVHSFGNVVLTSWGCDGAPGVPPLPNEQEILTLGRKYAYFPGYDAIIGSTGLVSGSTKDYSYGRLGVPGYTIELGTAFFESCVMFEHVIFEPNIQALLHMAKSVRTSYITPSGPDTYAVDAGALPVAIGDNAMVSAIVDDTRYAGGEPTQNIVAAEVYVNVPPWNGGAPIALSATDGMFDETVEIVNGSIATGGLGVGRHQLFFQGQDSTATFGATTGGFLYLVDPATSPTIEGSVRDSGGSPLAATVSIGPFTVISDAGTGSFSLQVPPGDYAITASAVGFAPDQAQVTATSGTEVVVLSLSPLSTLFTDDVEGGNAGWTAEGGWAITDEASNSPDHSWTDSPGGNYPPNVNSALTSPPLDFT
ncbi:MAG: M14 family zinc carboxypeptidase, partial [Xanthomonadales bacterium]|nr:M14 family zinc carboxypeptidase [Xanthomonadales bacterium]